MCACSAPPPPSPVADEAGAVSQLQRLPEADPAKYSAARETKAWRNPLLIVLSSEIRLVDLQNNEIHHLKTHEVLPALAKLPGSAWPYGRVVAVQVDEGGTDANRVQARANKGVVAGSLQDSHLAIQWMEAPSSK